MYPASSLSGQFNGIAIHGTAGHIQQIVPDLPLVPSLCMLAVGLIILALMLAPSPYRSASIDPSRKPWPPKPGEQEQAA